MVKVEKVKKSGMPQIGSWVDELMLTCDSKNYMGLQRSCGSYCYTHTYLLRKHVFQPCYPCVGGGDRYSGHIKEKAAILSIEQLKWRTWNATLLTVHVLMVPETHSQLKGLMCDQAEMWSFEVISEGTKRLLPMHRVWCAPHQPLGKHFPRLRKMT